MSEAEAAGALLALLFGLNIHALVVVVVLCRQVRRLQRVESRLAQLCNSPNGILEVEVIGHPLEGEIEVTEEMIDAGVLELIDYDDERSSTAETAERVFRVMAHASRRRG